MANSATALTKVPAHFKLGGTNGLIYPVVAVMDTAGDLDLYTPAADAYPCCIGMVISESAAFVGKMKGPGGDLFGIELSTVSQPIIHRIGLPLFIGRLGEKITAEITSGAITKCLLYFCDLKQIPVGF